MKRSAILREIKRTARENRGVPLGARRFARQTGIDQSAWRGRYWARWSEAVAEAGFEPNTANPAHSREFLVQQLADLTLRLGHFPTYAELRLARKADSAIPGHQAFNGHLGCLAERKRLVRELGAGDPRHAGVLDLIPQAEPSSGDNAPMS